MADMEHTTLRRLTAASLALFALLSFGFVLLAPEMPDDRSQWPAAAAASPVRAFTSAHLFLWSQPALAVGAVGLMLWLRPYSRKLATVGGVLAALGAFTHMVPGSWSLTTLMMGADPSGYDTYGRLLAAQEGSPHLIPYLMISLLGLVLGVMLLGVAHFRSRLPMRWAGPTLWAWLVVEFVGSNFSPWATPLSGVLLLLGVGGLVAGLLRGTALQPAREDAAYVSA